MEAAESTKPNGAFDYQHAPAPLPFDVKSLKGLSEKLIQSHWENNYTGAVKALNLVRGRLLQALNDTNTPPYIYNELKREQLLKEGHWSFQYGGHSSGLIDRDHLLSDPTAASHMAYAIAKQYFTDHVQTVATPSICAGAAGFAVIMKKCAHEPASSKPAKPSAPIGSSAVPSKQKYALASESRR